MIQQLWKHFGFCKSHASFCGPIKKFVQTGMQRIGVCFDRFFAFVESRREQSVTAVPEIPAQPVPSTEDRVQIGCNYNCQPLWKIILGVPLIYLPLIMTIPFMIPSILTVKTHLKLVGSMNIKSYWDFVPTWATHRYNYNTQIVLQTVRNPWIAWLCKTKVFWLFNCKLYCPLSVGVFSYMAYLVKIVENWWCPFNHDRKDRYAEGAIDYSFWHVNPEINLLDPQDACNPIWNRDCTPQNV